MNKKLSFDYMLKIILIVGVCAYILYKDFSRLKNSYYSLNIKGNTIKIYYKNDEREIITTEDINYVRFLLFVVAREERRENLVYNFLIQKKEFLLR